jgi:hypothetical protein
MCIGGLRKMRAQKMEMCNNAVFFKNLSVYIYVGPPLWSSVQNS